MAEEKKIVGNTDPFEEMVVMLFVLIIFGVIAGRLMNLFQGQSVFSSLFGESFKSYFFLHIVPIFKIIGFIISVVSFVGIVYAVRNLTRINIKLNSIYRPLLPANGRLKESVPVKNLRWEKVLALLRSNNQSDWKLAILEADIILGDLLDAMRYKGETVADKLKNIEESDFRSIEAAWEAHKFRNTIAHEGSDFLVTEREAKRIISLYMQVFEEFSFI
jgi:hypothetical protein